MTDTDTRGADQRRTRETTTEFDAFARRILRAYGRRVADGDIEALRSLAQLATELDAVTRLAVIGLRQPAYGYSWAEIAERLGVTRQAVHMRYGPSNSVAGGRLDQRLIDGGLSIAIADLVAVFTDHHPGTPAIGVPGCGYRYPDGCHRLPNQCHRATAAVSAARRGPSRPGRPHP